MGDEERYYGYEDGYADAQRGRIQMPETDGAYREGYEAGMRASIEGQEETGATN